MKETIIGKEDREKFFDEPLSSKSLEQRVEHIGFLWEQYEEWDKEIKRGIVGETDKLIFDETNQQLDDLNFLSHEIYGEISKVLQMDMWKN